jgi:hypothetical protein
MRLQLTPAERQRKLRGSLRCGIGDARRREAKKAKPAEVKITLDQMMAKVAAAGFCCALTGLPFWFDDADRFGPSCPSIDRIEPDGPYDDRNTRVVLLGVNSGRGRGSDDDMYRIAGALLANRANISSGRGAALKAWETRRARKGAN